MVNTVFRYCLFVGLCQSYMSILLFVSHFDGTTGLSNRNKLENQESFQYLETKYFGLVTDC
jgi:hypothetical protein